MKDKKPEPLKKCAHGVYAPPGIPHAKTANPFCSVCTPIAPRPAPSNLSPVENVADAGRPANRWGYGHILRKADAT